MTATAPSSASAHHSSVVPSEVGWQFVPQYYTFVNKEPHRLHCFYNKNSTFTHGTEGEEVKACHGQQEIHNKITSIGFDDCKVFIHSVDAQSSLNGGIIIQVIGEMSNHGEEWRKFVQTFFLAEQPNGYFVLNDIFRFLKEETVDSEDAGEVAAEEPSTAAPASAPPPPPPAAQPAPAPVPAAPQEPPAPVQPVAAPEPVYEPPREPTPPPAAAPAPEPTPVPAPVEEKPAPVPEPAAAAPTPAQEPQAPAAPTAQPNGIHTPEVEKAAPAVVIPSTIEPSPAPTPAPAAQPSQQQQRPATPAAPQPAPAPTAPSAAQPAPSAPTAAPARAPAPPQPAAPAVPRSWASLAASNSKKWGPAVAQEARGLTETVAPSNQAPAPAASPAPAAQRPQHQQQQQGGQRPAGQQQQGPGKHGHGHGHGHDHPAYIAAQSITTPQCFIKGVTEPITQAQLQQTLTSRFGPIKDLEIVRAKACAFLEFQSIESAKKAIIASLGQHQGGEGGVWIDVGGDVGQVRISIETKKERGDRPPSRPRGGAPNASGGEGRGAGQAHVNGGEAGRGGAGGFRGGRGGGRGGRGGAGGK